MKKSKRGKSQSKYTTVSIPRTLYNRIKKLVDEKGFKSVSDYVTYVLREVIVMHESESQSEPFTEEDLEEIKKRLRALGYI